MAYVHENDLGVHDVMSQGLLNVRNKLANSHPLEQQEITFAKREEEAFMAQARISQGLYAPFKLQMERDFARKIGRLPGLPSSNLMLQVLKGTDETIEIEDILNNQRYYGESNINPHVAIERRYK